MKKMFVNIHAIYTYLKLINIFVQSLGLYVSVILIINMNIILSIIPKYNKLVVLI